MIPWRRTEVPGKDGVVGKPYLIMTVSHANARTFSMQGFGVTRTATMLVKVDSNPDSRLRYPPRWDGPAEYGISNRSSTPR